MGCTIKPIRSSHRYGYLISVRYKKKHLHFGKRLICWFSTSGVEFHRCFNHLLFPLGTPFSHIDKAIGGINSPKGILDCISRVEQSVIMRLLWDRRRRTLITGCIWSSRTQRNLNARVLARQWGIGFRLTFPHMIRVDLAVGCCNPKMDNPADNNHQAKSRRTSA